MSDSGADTRDSENSFPASLADERKEREGKHTETEKRGKLEKERRAGKRAKEEEAQFCPLSF